jgi:hypothetical protein
MAYKKKSDTYTTGIRILFYRLSHLNGKVLDGMKIEINPMFLPVKLA